MQDERILKQLEVVRELTIKILSAIPESDWDSIPEGFRNNIRWNAGHIATVQDNFVYGLGKVSPNLPENYLSYFGGGTSPADWEEQPPSKEEILNVLQKQTAWIQQQCKDKLDVQIGKAFKGMETVGELLLFSIFHEGMHFGVINSLKKSLSN